MNYESILTERGQVTLPKEIRDQLGLKPGTVLNFRVSKQGILLQKASSEEDPIEKVFGMVDLKMPVDDYMKKLRGQSGMIRSAVDSNILLDVFAADPAHGKSSSDLLRSAINDGGLVICDVVLSEVASPFHSLNQLEKGLVDLNAVYEALNEEACFLAGQIWKKYRNKGGKRDKMIPDFMIAAHAFVQCDRLLTRDRGFYREYFPKLKIL